jgi:hypothetical protein
MKLQRLQRNFQRWQAGELAYSTEGIRKLKHAIAQAHAELDKLP